MKNNELWLNMWEKKNIPFHKSTVNSALIAYASQLSCNAGDTILVPLCGKSLDMVWLAQQGYKVIGIELSAIACEEFFSENNIEHQIIIEDKFTHYKSKDIEIFCGDFFTVTKNDFPEIKAIYDCKSLIALPAEIKQKYIKHLLQLVNPTAIKILLLVIEATGKIQGPPFPINKNEIKALFGSQYQIEELKRTKRDKIDPHLLQDGFKEITDVTYLIS